MASVDNEEIKQTFTGDTSGLQSAVEKAIGLLDRYESSLRKVTANSNFSKSTQSMAGYQRTISQTFGAVDTLRNKLKGVSNSDAFSKMSSTLDTIKSKMQGVANIQLFKKSSATADISNMGDTVQSVSSRISGAFQRVSTFVSSMSSRVVSMMATARNAIQGTGAALFEVSRAFRRTESTSDDAADSAASATQAHSNLGTSLKGLIPSLTSEIQALLKEDRTLENKNETLDDSSKKHQKLSFSLVQLGARLQVEGQRLTNFSLTLKNTSKATDLLKRAFMGLTGIKIGDWLSQGIKHSIDYTENLNLFTVAMGDAVTKGTEFINTMQELYGMDPSNLMRYAGNFYQLASAIEMPEQAATTMALALTKATNDISSLFNVDIDTVFQNLTSGMQGHSQAVRKYGMDIRQTTLQQTALSLGITQSVRNMSEANRQGLRFITMMRQASAASGDFARTIESPANQLKILREQVSQLGRAIGNFFIGPIGTAIAYLNGFIMALRTIITFIGSLFGIVSNKGTTSFEGLSSGAKKAASSIGGVGSAAKDTGKKVKDTAKKLKDLTAPFDELNVLQEPDDSSADSGSGGSLGGGGGGGIGSDIMDPAIAEAIANMSVEFENVRMKANEVRDALLNFFGFTYDVNGMIQWDPKLFESNLINKFPQWTKTIQSAFKNWSSIVQGFKNVFAALGGVFDRIGEKLVGFFSLFINDNTVSAFIDGLAGSLNNLATFINDHQEAIANFILILGGLFAAFEAFKVISALIGPIMTFVGTVTQAASLLNPVTAAIAAAAGAFILLYTNSETFAEAFKSYAHVVVQSLGTILSSCVDLMKSLWEGLQEIWTNNLQPLVESIGNLVGSILDTLGVLWADVSVIITDAIALIQNKWETNLQPTLGLIFEGIDKIIKILQQLWNDVFAPIIEHVAQSLTNFWVNTCSPVCGQIIDITTNIIDTIMGLWNNVLAPLTSWLVSILGPTFTTVFNTVWDVVDSVCTSIGGLISGLLDVFRGLTDFLAGVFTGDWKRALKGILEILVGLLNALVSIVEICINAIIGVVNSVISAIWSGIRAAINGIMSIVEGAADLLGFDINLKVTAEPFAIPRLSIPRVPVPAFAKGGIVSSPTLAMVGEGAYDEAIIPLGNSPQMEELLSRFANVQREQGSNDKSEIIVKVYIGGHEYDAFTYKAAKRGEKLVGAQPITEGE